MNKNGLLIGEVAKQSGSSRKALRLYEAAGILPSARRTASGYRVYGGDTLELVAFVRQAQRLGFSLGEIKDIVAIQRSGRLPCPHVHGSCCASGPIWIDAWPIWLTCARASMRCSGAGSRDAERLPSASTSSSRTGDQQRGEGMERRVSLCPMCDHCPEVAVVGDEVQIGEVGNLVVLKKAEWNVLVDAIKSGRLSKV